MAALSDAQILEMAHATRHKMAAQIRGGDHAPDTEAQTVFYLSALAEAALLGVDLVIQAMQSED